MSGTAVVIEPPVRGEWAVLNPPGHPALAFDFLATSGRKIPYAFSSFLRHLFYSIPVEAAYAWGRPVFAPLDGVVESCFGGAPDILRLNMFRDLFKNLLFPPRQGSAFEKFGGNYVILRCADGVYPLLAHLRRGSLMVKAGDSVKAGQQLGVVGNSGSSIQPHLHFQIMSGKDPFPLFRNLVPFRLAQARRRTGGEWKLENDVALHTGDHLRL